MVTRKHRVETGQEASIYYEVVQTGKSILRLLEQHQFTYDAGFGHGTCGGHCEFSELNVLKRL